MVMPEADASQRLMRLWSTPQAQNPSLLFYYKIYDFELQLAVAVPFIDAKLVDKVHFCADF